MDGGPDHRPILLLDAGRCRSSSTATRRCYAEVRPELPAPPKSRFARDRLWTRRSPVRRHRPDPRSRPPLPPVRLPGGFVNTRATCSAISEPCPGKFSS
jgi:hypothetical protein